MLITIAHPPYVQVCSIITVDLLERYDAALGTLRRVRAGMIAERVRDQNPNLRRELTSVFASRKRSFGKALQWSSACKRPKRPAWKHTFVCLAFCQQKRIPTTEVERDELFEAGLGCKDVEFPTLDLDVHQFRDLLYGVYSKLRDGGGFQLCRCLPNTRELEPLSKHVLSSPRLLKERVGNTRTYIVPLQKDLDLTPSLTAPDEVTEQHVVMWYSLCNNVFVFPVLFRLLRLAYVVGYYFLLVTYLLMLKSVTRPCKLF